MVRNLDQLAAFEEYQDEVLPKLREALKNGAKAEDIYQMAMGVAAARAVSIAVKEKDSSKALAAIKEIMDRTAGKATERKEVSHRLEKLPDEQLDSLLASKLDELESLDDDELN